MKCKRCKNEIKDGFKFCPYCGDPVVIGLKCPKCGSIDIPEGSRFCPDCGAVLNDLCRNTAVHEQVISFNVRDVSFDMVFVEGGTFDMGATLDMTDAWDDEKPAHQVTLTNNYYIGKTEVTQALWRALMFRNLSNFKGANRPVENVSWNDCNRFITELNSLTGKNFRLPTEAEWEFAARGGNESKLHRYSGICLLRDRAWYDINSEKQTHNVATRRSNELGIYDMCGNVWEWCSDWYDQYDSGLQYNPAGPDSAFDHVIRGGSWYNDARYCRVSTRLHNGPDVRSNYLGFRLALSE